MDDSENKKVNVVFSPETYRALQELAQKQNIDLPDAISQAIHISSLVVNANEDPNSRVLIQNGKNVQELKLTK